MQNRPPEAIAGPAGSCRWVRCSPIGFRSEKGGNFGDRPSLGAHFGALLGTRNWVQNGPCSGFDPHPPGLPGSADGPKMLFLDRAYPKVQNPHPSGNPAGRGEAWGSTWAGLQGGLQGGGIMKFSVTHIYNREVRPLVESEVSQGGRYAPPNNIVQNRRPFLQ